MRNEAHKEEEWPKRPLVRKEKLNESLVKKRLAEERGNSPMPRRQKTIVQQGENISSTTKKVDTNEKERGGGHREGRNSRNHLSCREKNVRVYRGGEESVGQFVLRDEK